MSEQLESLKITEKALEKSIEYTDKMSIAPANKQNKQAGLPKSMVLDLEWFDGDRTKFED